MQKLTPAELEIMQALWKLEKGYLRDIQKQSHDRAYTTVSSILRILKGKGFVSSNLYGNANEYFPLIGREEYMWFYITDTVEQYFNGSFNRLISFVNLRREM